MSFRWRLVFFGLGVLLGSLLVYGILKKRGLEPPAPPPETAAAAQREAVPGILKAYRERGEPLQSRFLVEEYREPAPGQRGRFRRVLVLEGVMPGQHLRVEEIQEVEAGRLRVVEWRVMAPDRVVVTLEEGFSPPDLRELLAVEGYRMVRRGEGPRQVVVDLGDGDVRAVDQAIQRLRSVGPPIQSVEPEFLDSSDFRP